MRRSVVLVRGVHSFKGIRDVCSGAHIDLRYLSELEDWGTSAAAEGDHDA